MQALVQQAKLTAHIEVDSAGTGGWHAGEPADSRSRAAARARGIELTSKACQFTVRDFDRFDYVLAMDGSNRRALLGMARHQADRDKVHLLRSFDPSAPADAEVPDPYYGGERGFEDVLDMCERACEGLLAHLGQHHGVQAGT